MENKFEEILKRAKENSIGNDKKSEFVRSVKVISKKVLTLLIVVSITVTLAACDLGNVKSTDTYPEYNNGEVIEMQQIESDGNELDFRKISEIRGDIVSSVVVKLINADIKYRTDGGTIINNDIETYKKIYNIKEDELIGYYMLLGREESDKIVQILGYEGWDDYLIQSGFVNEDNEPDIKMWENSIYENMQLEYERRMGK